MIITLFSSRGESKKKLGGYSSLVGCFLVKSTVVAVEVAVEAVVVM